MQLGGGSARSSIVADNTWTALVAVVRQQGLRTLWSGIVPTYAKVMPSCALAMTTTRELIGAYDSRWP